jgi:hypothetical protein
MMESACTGFVFGKRPDGTGRVSWPDCGHDQIDALTSAHQLFERGCDPVEGVWLGEKYSNFRQIPIRARVLMVNIAHLRKLNEAYTGRTAWVALADRRGRRHRPGCGFIVSGCGRPRNSGALSGPRRGGPCRRMRGVLYDRHFSASRGTFQVSTTSYTEGTQNHRIHILFSRRSVSARLT